MAYAHSVTARYLPAAAAPKVGLGLFRRLLAAMQAARQRQVDREIADYIAGHGGRLTDEGERAIERHILSHYYTGY